jgi:hypothetical protein
VSSENSAKAPTKKHSFDEKKSLFTDDAFALLYLHQFLTYFKAAILLILYVDIILI